MRLVRGRATLLLRAQLTGQAEMTGRSWTQRTLKLPLPWQKPRPSMGSLCSHDVLWVPPSQLPSWEPLLLHQKGQPQ